MPKVPAVKSTFALLDIKAGRGKLAQLVEQGYRIPFTIRGHLQAEPGAVGRDDGTSIEFGADVEEIALLEPQRREFARLSSLEAGDVVQLDGGFTCAKPYCKKTLHAHPDDGGLYFECDDGHHFLSGQIDDDKPLPRVIGVYIHKRKF